MSLKQSEVTQIVLDLIRRIEILEEHVIGKLPGSVEPPKVEAAAPKKAKKSAPKEVVDEFDLDMSKLPLMSNSELAQICARIGFPNASRSLHRDDLIGLIAGDEIDIEDPLSEQRENTFAFVSNNRKMLTSVLTCDMHCPTCPHHQVIECWSDNKDLVSGRENV